MAAPHHGQHGRKYKMQFAECYELNFFHCLEIPSVGVQQAILKMLISTVYFVYSQSSDNQITS